MFKYISHIPKKCLRKILLTFLLDKCFELAKHSITQKYVVWTLFLVLFSSTFPETPYSGPGN